MYLTQQIQQFLSQEASRLGADPIAEIDTIEEQNIAATKLKGPG
jgi:hypothetical protein